MEIWSINRTFLPLLRSTSIKFMISASAGTLCFLSGLATGLILFRKLRGLLKKGKVKTSISEKWVKVGIVSELMVYPVKSCAGMEIKEASLTYTGLTDPANPRLRDRTFMITDKDGNFMSQRTLPILSLIHPTLIGDKLCLKFRRSSNHSNNENIALDISRIDENLRVVVRLYGGEILYALDCGDEVGSWLAKVLGQDGLRLVYFMDQKRMIQERNEAFQFFRESDVGTFHEDAAYMIMTEESLTELNTHLVKRKVSFKPFRPNVMIKGSPEPWSEDYWTYIRIGNDCTSPILEVARPCLRCKMITVDLETGQFSEDGEPLETLKMINRTIRDSSLTSLVRKRTPAVMGVEFGLLENPGSIIIKVGDPVFVALL